MTNQVPKSVEERAVKLRHEIDRHRYLYHVLDKPEISDAALDSLKHELQALEDKYPALITPHSSTQRVGGKALAKFAKITHSSPMLSLVDAFSFDELKAWEERAAKLVGSPALSKGYFAELKMDGLAIALIYENGLLKQAATRGDGKVGEDVTNNIRTITAIPLKLRAPSQYYTRAAKGTLEVRGEVYMTKAAFEAVNREQKKNNQPLFANPRNAAAGSIRQLDPNITTARQLSFVVYEIVSDVGQKFHYEEHDIAKSLGFPTLEPNRHCDTVNAVEKYHAHWEKKKEQLAYQIDGVVVVVDDEKTREKLGVVGKAPRGMLAYKFSAEQVTTTVNDIIVQVGRTGTLTPVAIFEPVKVAGSTVSRATLHNQDEITRKDVRVGDTVIIQKAGDVIPEVVEVVKKLRPSGTKPWRMPKKYEGVSVVRREGEAAHKVISTKLASVKLRALQHFVGKSGFDIVGLGPKILHQLYTRKLVRSFPDIFKLSEADLRPLERFADKSAGNIIASIHARKTVELGRFLNAIGIPMVGEETAFDLAEHFGSLSEIMDADMEGMSKVYGIGERVARSLVDYFSGASTREMIKKLLSRGIKIMNPERAARSGPLKGKTFVFTGGMESMTRQAAEDKVRKLGGDASGSVSKDTTYVIAGSEPGSKFDKAQKLAVKIISETEFLKMVQ
ncbi:MAG TPA: NAD-dependent DNA ligase LigA [Patescibacteria group bacterium]|nr:NAD-dependent DNA ligase LigA [Patescibacteria group bacterium]